MVDPLLTNALVHEYARCKNAFDTYCALYSLVLFGSSDKKVSIACYNAYSDFLAHLYEFYLGCIKRDGRYPKDVSGKAVDDILNAEVEKLLRLRRERILRGDAPPYENHISYYEVPVPREFGAMFRTARNIRSHALAKRSEFDLADFYLKYHRFAYILFHEPAWLWDSDYFPEHEWLAVERFAKAVARKKS